MKKNIKNLFGLACAVVFCLALSIVLGFTGRNNVEDTPVRNKEYSGVSVNAVSVLDVKGVMKMTAFNYQPDEFVELHKVVSNADRGESPAKRGTYRFVIDTLTLEEYDRADSLSHLLAADGEWHLTMYIPPVFSACSVYVQYQNKAYVGLIDRYNVAYYTSFSSPSEFDETVSHNSATQPLFLDISIPADVKYSRACVVTVHYEADNNNFVGVPDGILIGEDAAVRKAVNGNRSMLLVGAMIAATTFLLFLFICILKHSLAFVPQLSFAAGIFLALFSTYLLFGFTDAPYFLLGLRRFSAVSILTAATLYLPKKTGKIPVLYITCALAVLASALSFVSPFITSVAAYRTVCLACVVSALVCIAVVYGFTVYDVVKGKPLGFRLNGAVAGVLLISVLSIRYASPFILLAPAFWLCLGMLGITLVLGFREFISAEIRNRYLTTNLEQEVARQTQNLQTVISERDKILLYVSHDMKKTAVGINGSLSDLRQNISETALLSKVDYLLQKSAELKKDFADLGKYGKQNFIAEQSEVLDLSAIMRKVTDELRPDCEANGIVLTAAYPEKLNVYAKKIALESVLLNLILNAIEHSFCSFLSVTATKRKGLCRIDVVDDGRGVATDRDVFEPFVSGSSSENNSGLGLFLAKTAVESMHGQLTYERKDRLTIFSATLPLA